MPIDSLVLELVYDRDCPNVPSARAMITAALLEVGAEPKWREWDRAGGDTPLALRAFGSPTVLVNGQDVSCTADETTRADANACRVYRGEGGAFTGAPSTGMIVSAINRAAMQ